MSPKRVDSPFPAPIGLYDPRFEHDACGVGFVARIGGEPGHQVLQMALGRWPT